MKSVSEMSEEEVIINCRDNSGTDDYVLINNAAEHEKVIGIMEKYYTKDEEKRKIKAEKLKDRFTKSMKSWGKPTEI